MNYSDSELLNAAKNLMRTEANEILRSADNLGLEIVNAAREIFACEGRVVVVGLGKSGHVGRKISATLASLGTPSFFLHAAEAFHGDLGMVRREDVGLLISNSGASSEIVALLPHFRRIGAKMIAVTGSLASPLALHSDIIINAHVETEGDPLQLAPMSSTTLELAVGDALAVLVETLRGLKREDFALFHPGGTLGRKLLTRASDLMGTGEQLPIVKKGVTVKDALFVITGKGYGATCVVDENDNLIGIFTDGDLRRLMEKSGNDAFNTKIDDAMTKTPRTISPEALAAEAVRIMEQKEISVLIVTENNKPVGIVHIHDLLKAGIA
ncbi:MAG: KpsF/GutQ family sugar-phosphate isomerase [Synergistales bacterium]|nr:KpsF/GutQ family sugar-phosphate isomerase [Synergistales bacterium]MDY6401987.1 KpsF/GutQ family sugar-phosphate isomerase [Synergistales bacterium]MDY6405158.1 KpsF/GutQ family sugar-phosphate isomerase [Synergistales bacterium]MDY6414061.1 KpsF/GutQ family sugar-phosphate isomerase [Synergistales bacterium]MDY6423042.1 KpsF/GutQ family sugar-phosphate isomerase [Synergistales bacterium]